MFPPIPDPVLHLHHRRPDRKTAPDGCGISAQPRGRNRNPLPPLSFRPRTAGRLTDNWQETDMAKKAPTASALTMKGEVNVREHLGTPTDLKAAATRDISAGMNGLLADVFALYLKTKNFHWHMSGPHFRDYHLLLDEHSDQIFAMTDPIAERVRGNTLHSIGQIKREQRILDNDAEYVEPHAMLAELRDDNSDLTKRMREVHGVCDEHGDVATASLLEVWIDETERRTWFLFESTRTRPGANS
jgi:starvation-inducible DNA-binding protein